MFGESNFEYSIHDFHQLDLLLRTTYIVQQTKLVLKWRRYVSQHCEGFCYLLHALGYLALVGLLTSLRISIGPQLATGECLYLSWQLHINFSMCSFFMSFLKCELFRFIYLVSLPLLCRCNVVPSKQNITNFFCIFP